MMRYEAPTITEQRTLTGSLDGFSNVQLQSDAAIKHGVQPLDRYEAPAITGQRALDGRLQISSQFD